MKAQLLVCAAVALGCDSHNGVAARVSCYPPCLARVVEHCPMLSICDSETETDVRIPNPAVRSGVATCFASGEKRWQATNTTNGDSYIVVKRVDGNECYTAISQGASMLYSISVAQQPVAVLDAQSQTAPPTVTCDGMTSDIVVTPDCLPLPWLNPIGCEPAACDLGDFPTGAATDTTN